MKSKTVKITAFCELDEIVYIERSFAGQKLNRETALGCGDNGLHGRTDARQRPLVVSHRVAGLHYPDTRREIPRAVCFQ